jgi:hypothetical protein
MATVRRYHDEIGNLGWAAPMDWMCEPFMLAKTGLTIAVHQVRTVANYLELRSLTPDLPFVAVLQGWSRDDYLCCVELTSASALTSPRSRWSASGRSAGGRRPARSRPSCTPRRHGPPAARLRRQGLRAHALRDCLVSADSLAWSLEARRGRRYLAVGTPTVRTACGMQRRGGSGRWRGWARCSCTCGWRGSHL